MVLTSINYKILNDHRRIDLISRTIVILTPLAAEDSTIEELIAILKEKRDQLKSALGWSAKSELTERITEFDAIRDDAITMIGETARLYTKKRQANFSSAATLILAIYNDIFASVSLSNNTESTTAIDLFLEKTATEEATAALSTLRLTTEIDAIKESQPQFIALTAERAKLKESDVTPRLVPSRDELYTELKHLVSHLNYKGRRKSESHTAIIEELNGPIKEIMAAAKSEETRSINN